MSPRTWTHAGGIVVRLRAGRPEFLLVTSRRDPDAWVLPKGRIERDEKAKETAVREVREESGVTAEIVGKVGRSRYERDGSSLTVRYYAMRPVAQGAPKENRQVEWCNRAEARARLTWPGARDLLERAAVMVAAEADGPAGEDRAST